MRPESNGAKQRSGFEGQRQRTREKSWGWANTTMNEEMADWLPLPPLKQQQPLLFDNGTLENSSTRSKGAVAEKRGLQCSLRRTSESESNEKNERGCTAGSGELPTANKTTEKNGYYKK